MVAGASTLPPDSRAPIQVGRHDADAGTAAAGAPQKRRVRGQGEALEVLQQSRGLGQRRGRRHLTLRRPARHVQFHEAHAQQLDRAQGDHPPVDLRPAGQHFAQHHLAGDPIGDPHIRPIARDHDAKGRYRGRGASGFDEVARELLVLVLGHHPDVDAKAGKLGAQARQNGCLVPILDKRHARRFIGREASARVRKHEREEARAKHAHRSSRARTRGEGTGLSSPW
jgi:hypothetical protein